MPAPALAEVHVASVPTMHLPNAAAQRGFDLRHRDQVHMVRHQAGARSIASVPSKRKRCTLGHSGSVPHVDSALLALVRHEVEVRLVVLVAEGGSSLFCVGQSASDPR